MLHNNSPWFSEAKPEIKKKLKQIREAQKECRVNGSCDACQQKPCQQKQTRLTCPLAIEEP